MAKKDAIFILKTKILGKINIYLSISKATNLNFINFNNRTPLEIKKIRWFVFLLKRLGKLTKNFACPQNKFSANLNDKTAHQTTFLDFVILKRCSWKGVLSSASKTTAINFDLNQSRQGIRQKNRPRGVVRLNEGQGCLPACISTTGAAS